MKRKRAGETCREQARGEPASRAFSELGAILQGAGIKPRPADQGDGAKPKEEPPLAPSPFESEETLFARAMEGIRRAQWQTVPGAEVQRPDAASSDPGQEERRLMEAAAGGIPKLRVADHPEYIEGWVDLSGKRFISELRSGTYSIQEQLDLHGMTQDEARIAVEEFIDRVSRFRSCCVKIIHGRGMNSPGARSILKEKLPGWLSTRRMSRHVVAYASAPFADGGVGAIYLLLRRS